MEKMEPIFDLHERTFRFAVQITNYVRTFPRDVVGFEFGKQLIRCGCSPGSNYEEADESASPKDFIYKIRTCLHRNNSLVIGKRTLYIFAQFDPEKQFIGETITWARR